MWPPERIAELLERFHRARPDVQVLLLGGPDELEAMDHLHEQLLWTIHTGGDNNEPQFVALVDACDVLFSGDTMALHVAVARQRGVVAFIGPTCEQEIDLFGRGEKLIARADCAPCYKHKCDHRDQCLTAVTIEEALGALSRVMDQMRSDRMRIEPHAAPLRKAG
jgi:heptosyltransferase-2